MRLEDYTELRQAAKKLLNARTDEARKLAGSELEIVIKRVDESIARRQKS